MNKEQRIKKKLLERQEQMDKLNATKIILTLFWNEYENDSFYLYDIYYYYFFLERDFLLYFSIKYQKLFIKIH